MPADLLDPASLEALRLLLDTASVTDAARRAGTTQPAMSRTLARLRERLGDPLLVPVGGRLQLTDRAIALRQPVDEALLALSRVSRPEGPEPERRTFRLAASDHALVTLVRPWLAGLRARSPWLSLHVTPTAVDNIGALSRGELELVLAPRVPVEGMDALVSRPLFDDEMACGLRRGHPALRGRFDLKRYVALDHVTVGNGLPGLSGTARAVHAAGHTRRVVCVLPSTLAAIAFARTSDVCVALPRRLLEADGTLVIRPLPVKVEPFVLHAHWHPRSTTSPLHRAVRESLFAAAQPAPRKSKRPA